jgi:hypothetical protein
MLQSTVANYLSPEDDPVNLLAARMNPNIAAQGAKARASMAPPTSIMDPRYPAWKKSQDDAELLMLMSDIALSAVPLAGPAARGAMATGRAAGRIATEIANAEMAGRAGLSGQGGAIKLGKTIPRTVAKLTEAVGAENADIARSLMTTTTNKTIPRSVVEDALQNRNRYRAEPQTTPGPNAPEEEWAQWGNKYGVNMTRTPDQSMGISDLTTGREIMIPGGLEGKFTIPDMFQIKANNFDPGSLPKEMHDALMQKFIRTHDTGKAKDISEKFNALNFALQSPNAPLTQNQFLAARFRTQSPQDVLDIAAQSPTTNTRALSGVGAASSGGMGALGTANLSNMKNLSEILRVKPELFDIGAGETMRDVTRRVMNQVPGLGPKTASLGTPWLDLPKANTSAVDLHMIRNSWKRMLNDPAVGDSFRDRMASLIGTNNTPTEILAFAEANPQRAEAAAINVIGGTTKSQIYRSKKTGELVGGLDPALAPNKLAFEPSTVQDFNPFYSKVVDYVDQSRGQNPVLELFPEQWRKWDTFRQRVEPHEMAHPDFQLLPKQSWSEMHQALGAHKKAGYTSANNKVMKPSDWRDLYYGQATPEMLGILGLGAGGAAVAAPELFPNELMNNLRRQ